MKKTVKFVSFKFIFTTLLCGMIAPVSAHIHRIEHWSNGTQSLYLVHDYHISSHPQNKICDQQQADLLNAAQTYNAFVIAEDMSVYNNELFFSDPYNYDPNIPAVHNKRKKHPVTRPPIVGLTVHCQDQKIPVTNLEFRQASVASRRGEKRIPAQQVFEISTKVRDEICNYHDCPALNAYYQEEVERYDRNISNAPSIFEPIKHSDKPLKEVLPQLQWCEGADAIFIGATHFDENSTAIWSKESRFDIATDLYDMRLLDARIMHTIYKNQHLPCVFVCVGSEHLRHIKPVLETIGYEQIDTIGESYIRPDGTATEPDAIHITEAFDTLPKPITTKQPPTTKTIDNTWVLFLAMIIAMVFCLFFRKKRQRK